MAHTQAFIDKAMSFTGDECLLWPYAKNDRGYPQVRRGGRVGKISYVHRLVCENANGPPPDLGHEAIHSCGNGHLGCVTPNHVRWGTHIENMADKRIHGTHLRGESQNGSKLKEKDVLEIRSLLGHMKHREIAERYGVATSVISRIKAGTRWGWL